MSEIEWTSEAWNAYQKTVKFWIGNNKSKSYSEKIILKVEEIETQLASNFPIGQETENPGIYRARFLKYYSIFHRVINNRIEIIAFWDARRNPDKLDLKHKL